MGNTHEDFSPPSTLSGGHVLLGFQKYPNVSVLICIGFILAFNNLKHPFQLNPFVAIKMSATGLSTAAKSTPTNGSGEYLVMLNTIESSPPTFGPSF